MPVLCIRSGVPERRGSSGAATDREESPAEDIVTPQTATSTVRRSHQNRSESKTHTSVGWPVFPNYNSSYAWFSKKSRHCRGGDVNEPIDSQAEQAELGHNDIHAILRER
jgi:hypothetical protein